MCVRQNTVYNIQSAPKTIPCDLLLININGSRQRHILLNVYIDIYLPRFM